MDRHSTKPGAEHPGLNLEDKVAIVSGAGTYGGSSIGNGAAAAILFANHGANVILVDKELKWARRTKKRIADAGGEAIAVSADVTNPEECEAVVKQTLDTYGEIDILHNNVGGGPKASVADADDESWQQSLDLNLLSLVHMCRHVIPHMSSTGGGSVTNVSSVQARRPSFNYVPYAATNASVIGATRAIAIDHAQDDIRVNCIMPGPVWTPKVASSSTERERELRNESVPISREGEPWDIGWAAVFLASDIASWITGVTLPVDGGVLLTRGGNRPGMF